MVLGKDAQYDLTWEEQDRIRRRQEIRARLKAEYTRLSFDPVATIRGEYINDPALERFIALKKNPPLPQNIPLGMWLRTWGFIVIPIILYGIHDHYFQKDFEERCRSGELKYEDRTGKWRI